MATIVCKQGNANSAEHPHIIWLHAIQDTRRHDILSEVPAFPNVGSAIPHALRRDRMTEAPSQKQHWKHRLDGVSSVLMPPGANGRMAPSHMPGIKCASRPGLHLRASAGRDELERTQHRLAATIRDADCGYCAVSARQASERRTSCHEPAGSARSDRRSWSEV